MDTISHALKNIIKEIDDPEMRSAFAPSAWRRAAGEELARHTAFVGLENGRMTIAVADAMWKKQLEKMAARFVHLCAKELGKGSVKYVGFVIAPEKIAPRTAKLDTAKTEIAADEITPELNDAAANIANKRLREAFIGAAANSLSRKKKREEL
jgi:hypothetical protein